MRSSPAQIHPGEHDQILSQFCVSFWHFPVSAEASPIGYLSKNVCHKEDHIKIKAEQHMRFDSDLDHDDSCVL